jgi:hypothetical protein
MLNPSIDQLLAGMADALARTVLPELPTGPARAELQAAIALTRRLARAVPQLGPYLHTDTVDLAHGLTELWAALGRPEPTEGPAADALVLARSLPATPPPDAIALTAADLALRQALADLAWSVGSDPGEEGSHRRDVEGSGDLDDTAGAGDKPESNGPDGPQAVLRALVWRLADREEELQLSPWTRLH